MRISVPPAATWIILYLLVAALFAALYRVVPDVELEWKDVALAATITSLLFMIGKEFMGLYFAHASFGSMYSAAGAPMVVLLWVYYSAQLCFWGAEFTKVYAQTVGLNATGVLGRVDATPARRHMSGRRRYFRRRFTSSAFSTAPIGVGPSSDSAPLQTLPQPPEF